MRNGPLYVCRHLVYRLTLQCTKREMGLQNILQNGVNAFNSLGRVLMKFMGRVRHFEIPASYRGYIEDKLERWRSRKLLLVTLVLLVLMYYTGPLLFRLGRSRNVQIDPTDDCLAQHLVEFQSKIDNFDAFASGDLKEVPAGRKLAYVGNGNVAAALGTDNGLYIRLHRALSQPVKYWPVIQTHIGGDSRESTVLDVKAGQAYKIQVKYTPSGCVSVRSQIYAHRTRPNLLVQDIRIHNPSHQSLTVELDQVGASGWEGVTVQQGSYTPSSGQKNNYKIYAGTVQATGSDYQIVVAIASVSVGETTIKVGSESTTKLHFLTAVHYTKPISAAEASSYLPDTIQQAKGELEKGLNINENILKQEHIRVWGKLWFSGFGISYSLAEGALNGDRINKTIYYVLSNSPALLHNVMSTPKDKLEIEKVLYYPDRCYEGHSTLVSGTLWVDPEDESQIARVVTTWMITLEKQGCKLMSQAGSEGVLQAMILSLGPLHFHNKHLEMTSHPRDLHRDLHFRRINYGNNTHVNISVLVGEDNKATLFVALDRNDKPYYGCDAGCLDPPVPLSKERHQFPVKLTDPVTSVLYITADKQHMEELKHAIHVKEIIEAPAHEHHVIALHKHGHHFGGLPTIFWVSIAFLIIVFHLFLFKLIYNEYCQAQDKFTRSRYNL